MILMNDDTLRMHDGYFYVFSNAFNENLWYYVVYAYIAQSEYRSMRANQSDKQLAF